MEEASCVEAYEIGPDQTQAFVRKNGDKWCVYSEKGKHLGCYPSKKAADERLRQIEYFKHHPKATVVAGQIEAKPKPGSKKNELPEPGKVYASETNFEDLIQKNILGKF
jgi:hypothetical protein